ncbi:hypothetical protein PG996_008042 [Apiospora saccharicola]|uniref:Uncharacterized protein n=1 Tax=Apiospora saccharicola TaxID=335842 RepID=A0ABR1UWS9_9PEZI
MQLIRNLSKVLVAGLLATCAVAELTKVPRVVDKRDRETVDQGHLLSKGPDDELYTLGLATCIGTAAIVTMDEDMKIDKVLAHVSANKELSYILQFAKWQQTVKDSKMTDLKIYLSVPRKDVQPASCQAMEDMIKWAKQTCIDLGVGCVTIERKNEDVNKDPPFGTVLINYNQEVYMEGKKVS